MQLEFLRQLIKEQIEQTDDTELLDFVYKLLASESGNQLLYTSVV